MIDVVRMGGTATADEIVRHVATVYGRKSVTAQLSSHLNAVLEWAVANGHLSVSGDLHRLPDLT